VEAQAAKETERMRLQAEAEKLKYEVRKKGVTPMLINLS